MDIVQWRPVAGYVGAYEVSDDGRVRSLDREVYAGLGRTRKHKGRELSIFHGDNYSKVRLKLDGDGGKTHNVHTLVLTAFEGPCPVGLEACHDNGNPHDNRLSNLRYDTHVANSLDRRRHGTAFSRRDQESCFHGHPYAEGTFYIDGSSGKRVCLHCEAVRGERRRATKRAAEGRVHRSELTHCTKGHEFDGHNGRQKTCSTCAAEFQARYRAKKRADRQ